MIEGKIEGKTFFFTNKVRKKKIGSMGARQEEGFCSGFFFWEAGGGGGGSGV